jgi:HD-GYP domain-containing protein (c-di-GMP phosphodiesterase class II)
LKGEEIPLAARIFAVADVFDAMIQDRPYRKARPLDDVINHLRSESGKQFDPEVVETFLKLLEATSS